MRLILSILVICFVLSACNERPLPKPTGYFRIDLPEKNFKRIDTLKQPISFEIPAYAHPNPRADQEGYLNIDFPYFDARIHLSYIPVEDNLNSLLEDARTLVYKHVAKAQDINEGIVMNTEDQVYGMYYQIAGNAASGAQFYLTDSVNNFLRGALYFNTEPNFDSIAPVQEYLKQDIEHFIESFKWKNEKTP